MSQPTVFVHKEFMKEQYRVTITGTIKAPGRTYRDMNRKEAVQTISSYLQEGITNVVDAHGLLEDAYTDAMADTGPQDGECFFCGNEWNQAVYVEDYKDAYPHQRIPLCDPCKEELIS